MKRQNQCDFCFNHKSIFIFYTKLYIKMILNYVMEYIFKKTFVFMQNVCKMAIN